MKKIWPWLLLLLLLIIFCVWSKKDSIELHTTTKASIVSTPLAVMDTRHIEFILAQKAQGNTLNGKFTNIQQQHRLSDTCNAAASKLVIENTSTNNTLKGKDVLELTNKILPHFLAHYSEGSIRYNNEVLKISGVVDSYEAQHEMQRLLNTSTLASQDNSSVLVTKPIEFSITKDADKMHFKGTFNDQEQMNRIHSKLPKYASTSFTQAPHRIDNGAIATTEQILPDFSSRYTHGSIVYQGEILTVSGMVEKDEDLVFMKALLSTLSIPVVNQTTLDLEAVAKRKAEAAAKLAQIASETKAQEEAQKEAALRQASALVKQKAEEAAKRQEEANQKAEVLRLEKAKLAAQRQDTAQAAKKKITQLLQVENIEFETAKGSLTSKGKEAVDKLALILKQYPNIKAEIAGHTDSDGSAEFNQKLSQERVETVKGRLISRGINAGQLTAKGYGETKPLVPNTTDENKQKNRRVEINILGE